jgi:predicted NodU family carbamoyl transferase
LDEIYVKPAAGDAGGALGRRAALRPRRRGHALSDALHARHHRALDDRVPAVTHVDGSSRRQPVHWETNPRYCRLIEQFGEASGVPLEDFIVDRQQR